MLTFQKLLKVLFLQMLFNLFNLQLKFFSNLRKKLVAENTDNNYKFEFSVNIFIDVFTRDLLKTEFTECLIEEDDVTRDYNELLVHFVFHYAVFSSYFVSEVVKLSVGGWIGVVVFLFCFLAL